ncbi:MAG: CAP domain-containing protein [Nocardioides sp.]|nr:CAP domain-containing protein [Nocardioides sp.]
MNAARADAGCGALSTDGALTAAAQGHSADMAANDYFSHTSQDGRSFGDRIRAAGYGGGAIAENIAAGQSSASSVMASWMDSAGHRANILNCSYSHIGVGVAQGGSMGTYWTQTFGG